MSDVTQGWAKIGHHPKSSNKPIIRLPMWKIGQQKKFKKRKFNFLMRNSWVNRLACWLGGGGGGYLRRDLTLSFPVSCAKMTLLYYSLSATWQGGAHRVSRVLSFFPSRLNWDSPNPSPAGECAPLPFCLERGCESPNSDEGTYTVVLYIYRVVRWNQDKSNILDKTNIKHSFFNRFIWNKKQKVG